MYETVQTVPQRLIFEQLDVQEELVDELQKKLCELTARLDPVLLRTAAFPASSGVREEASPFAMRIMARNDALRDALNTVRELIDGLQI